MPSSLFPSAASHGTFKRKFRALRDALDFKLIQDGLRHTAAIYHFADCGDAAKTAALLGERDTRTLLEHYKGLASKAEAEQFYTLHPKVVHGDSTAIVNDLSGRVILGHESQSPDSESVKMALPARFERATCGLGNRRSIHLSYGSKSSVYNGFVSSFICQNIVIAI